jgi:hypothetical protein
MAAAKAATAFFSSCVAYASMTPKGETDVVGGFGYAFSAQ